MESLRGIVNFVRVAELGSFAKAGRALGISPVAVSKNISRLEAGLGVRLFARSTRHLKLTTEGEAFLDQCQQPLGALESACVQVAAEAQQPTGLVRVTLVSPVAHLYLLPFLPTFFENFPGIRLALELSEEVNPLIAHRFDVGIRMGALNDAAYVARPLGPLKLLLCASPGYLAANGVPNSLDALVEHALLQFQMAGEERPRPWPMAVSQGAARHTVALQLPARLICNDYRALLVACVGGCGIAMLPQPLALADLRSGALQVVLPEHTLQGLQLFVHYSSRKQLPARVRAFVDFMVQGLGGHSDLSADITGFSAPQDASRLARA